MADVILFQEKPLKTKNMKTTIKTESNNSFTNITKLAFFMFMIAFTSNRAQDIITYKNGDVETVKITEVTETEIKFKKTDNLDGPLRIVLKTELFAVKFENGTKMVMDNSAVTPPATTINNITVNTPVVRDERFEKDSSDFARIRQKRFGGPRVGVTYISPGTSADYLAYAGKQPLVTQFGWQFEGRLFTVDGNTQGMIEFIPLVGGMEQGLFIPSASLMLGVRFGDKRPFELGIGPNFSVVKDYKRETTGAMGVVFAFGTSLKSGNINFPINIAFVPSVGSKHNEWDHENNREIVPQKSIKYVTGWRLSLMVGFNNRKK